MPVKSNSATSAQFANTTSIPGTTPSDVEQLIRMAGALRLFRRWAVGRRVRPLLWAPNEPILTTRQCDSLDLIVDGTRWNMIEIAKLLDVSPSGATRAIDHLVAKGLVVRRYGDDDKRARLVSATRRGRALQRRLMENRLRILNDAVSDFSADEVASLVDLTERFITNLDSVVREHTETESRRSGRSIETGDL